MRAGDDTVALLMRRFRQGERADELTWQATTRVMLRNDGYTKILDFGLTADRAAQRSELPMGTVR